MFVLWTKGHEGVSEVTETVLTPRMVGPSTRQWRRGIYALMFSFKKKNYQLMYQELALVIKMILSIVTISPEFCNGNNIS